RQNTSPYKYRLSEASSAKDMEKAYIASFAVGGAALVAGIVLFVMTDDVFPANGNTADSDGGPRFFAAPQLSAHGAGFVGRVVF
ncbi:MAG: hypothetical protein GXP54_05790, partial [Deltaproteobacteria bacterium]|nr:hypothetical protein [Deltaproteobacteria bacterium]